VLDVFVSYNVTQFLNALAYFLSRAFALSRSFLAYRLRKVARDPTELIAEFCFANYSSVSHDVNAVRRSYLFLRKYLYFLVSSHLPSPNALSFTRTYLKIA
jgi:hypothetical protein